MAIDTRKASYVRAGNIIISSATAGDYISIWALETQPNGKPLNYLTIDNGFMKHVGYEEGKEGPEFLRIPSWGGSELLRDLVDALLAFGIKPKEHAIDENEKLAMEKHLQDMRKIVSKQLDIDL